MDNISDILDPSCIDLDLKTRKKEDIIRELVQLLADSGKIKNVQQCVTEVLEREKISTTGIGHGIAIPHRLIADVSDIFMAVGRNAKGVNFDSIDRKPAHLIFLIIGPKGRHNDYIKVLSKLSRLLSDRTFFEALMRVGNIQEMLDFIKEREEGTSINNN
ncbi:MAG: PTS sugar transporter subunit IIA [Chitinispirillales bacterium]|jgi:fructose-specific phosphotransferase system IIA component|nr:PTS sugar transporter subunit IIA [Chitinispirillales bacterium]